MKGRIYFKLKCLGNGWAAELKAKIGVSTILIALFLFSYGCSTKAEIDLIGMKKGILEELLRVTPENPLKVDILNELAYQESWNGGQTPLDNVNSAKKLAEQIDYKEGLVEARYILGLIYFLRGEFDKSKTSCEESLDLAKRIKYSTGEAMAYNGIARYHQVRGEYAEALKNFLKSEAICKNSADKKDKRALAGAYYGLGALYYYDPEDYKEALKYFGKYRRFGKEIGDNIIIISGDYTIGEMWQNLNQYDKAKRFFWDCVEKSNEIGLIYNTANAYEGLGDVATAQKKYEEARLYYEKSHQHFLKTENALQVAEIKKRLGGLYNKMGEDFQKKEYYKKALEYLREALKIAIDSNIPKTVEKICNEIIFAYNRLNHYKSEFLCNKLLKEIKEFLLKNEMLKQKLILDFEKAAEKERLKRTFLIIGLIGLSIVLVVVLRLSIKLRKQKVKIEDQAKRLEEALIKEKELSDHKDDLMKTVSHQYKTPLANINSTVQVLRDYLPKLTPQEIENQYNKILSNLERMAHLIDQLLKFGKIFTPAEHDLDRICRDFIEELKSNEGDKHNIEFTSSGDCGKIKVDKDYLEIILQNLVNNSIKFSSEGSKISLELFCDKESAVIKVSDNGIGIPEDYLKMPFERYHRGSNVGAVQGTGLGLAIVKRYTDLHCGDISIDSHLNAGTTVTLKIPRIACEKKGVSYE
ncbi:MAG: tetratricopeptide repeat-containing sensor histidine kinase [Candidatus Aminicenantes bacterium]|nr:tetratricopeptide repeat-containing sensor histidine kinase [Candidatus Aminicenantes bacterium]